MGFHGLPSKTDYLTVRAVITMVIMIIIIIMINMIMITIIIAIIIIINIIIAIIMIIICNEGIKLAKAVFSGDLRFHTI